LHKQAGSFAIALSVILGSPVLIELLRTSVFLSPVQGGFQAFSDERKRGFNPSLVEAFHGHCFFSRCFLQNDAHILPKYCLVSSFTVCTFILSPCFSLSNELPLPYTPSLFSKHVLKHPHRDPAADASGRPIAVRSRCLVKLQLRPATRWVRTAVAGSVCTWGSVID